MNVSDLISQTTGRNSGVKRRPCVSGSKFLRLTFSMKQIMFASHQAFREQELFNQEKTVIVSSRRKIFLPIFFLVTLEQKMLLQQYNISLISNVAQPYRNKY